MNFRTTSLLFGALLGMLFLFGIIVEYRRIALDEGYVLPSIGSESQLAIDKVELRREDSKTYVLTKKDTTWTMKDASGKASVRLIGDKVEDLIRQARTARKVEGVDLPTSLDAAGLTKPSVQVTLTSSKKNQSWTLNLGKKVSDELYTFASSSERARDAYAVKTSALDAVLVANMDELRSRSLSEVTDGNAQLVSLKQGGDKAAELALERSPDGSWRIQKPDLGTADFEGTPTDKEHPGVKALLNSIGGVRVEDLADFVPLEGTLESYGLDNGKETLRIDIKRGKLSEKDSFLNETLLIGKATKSKGTDQYYARLLTDEYVVRVSAKSLEPIFTALKDPNSLRSRDLLPASAGTPDALDIRSGAGLKTVLQLRKTDATEWKLLPGDGVYKANLNNIEGTKGLLETLRGQGAVKKFYNPADDADAKKLDTQLGFDAPTAEVLVYTGAVDKEKKPAKKEEKPTIPEKKETGKTTEKTTEKKETGTTEKKETGTTEKKETGTTEKKETGTTEKKETGKTTEKKDTGTTEKKDTGKTTEKATEKKDTGTTSKQETSKTAGSVALQDTGSTAKKDTAKATGTTEKDTAKVPASTEKKDTGKAPMTTEKKETGKQEPTPPKQEEPRQPEKKVEPVGDAPVLLKGAQPAVTLIFGKTETLKPAAKEEKKPDPLEEKKDDKKPEAKDKDKGEEVVHFKRIDANGKITRGSVPVAVLQKLVPPEGYLAFLNEELPAWSASEATRLELVRGGEKYILEKKKGEKDAKSAWQFVEPKEGPLTKVDEDNVEMALSKLATLRVAKWVKKVTPTDNLEELGLKVPVVSATVLTKKKDEDKGETHGFHFGKAAEKDKTVFAIQVGGQLVFQTPLEPEKFLQEVELSDRGVFSFETAKVKEIKLEGWKKDGKTTVLELKRKSNADWETVPKEYDLDGLKAELLLLELAKLKAEKIVARKGGPLPAHKLGAADETLTLALKLEDGKTNTLTLGVLTEDKSGYYAQASTLPGVVFVLPRQAFEPLVTSARQLSKGKAS